jgi:hypothetical protein
VNAFSDWLGRVDRRLLLGGGAVVVGLGVIAFVLTSSAPAARGETQTTAGPSTPNPTATPFRQRATPPGTPAPRPSTFVGLTQSIPVKVTPGVRATPTPEPGLWRIEGYVVDESGAPIENVCVVIGPVPCQPFTPKTDERGHYFFDVASAPVNAVTQVTFDLYFEYPGRETKWVRIIPTSSTVFNLILRRSS